MTDLPPFSPAPPPESQEQRPKRGKRKKAEAAPKPKRVYKKRTPGLANDPLAGVFQRDVAKANKQLATDIATEVVLSWWDILVQLDAAGRKQVLQKILA